MARSARIKNLEEIEIYSVVTKTNNNQYIFNEKNLDVIKWFFDILKQIKKKYGFFLFAYVVMENHIHLLIQPNREKADISDIMREINGCFAKKYNKEKKTGGGHLWKERFSHKIVKGKSHLKRSLIYFLKNPVRAGIVKNPLKYMFHFGHDILKTKNYKDSNSLVDFYLLDRDVINYVMGFINQFMEFTHQQVKKFKKVKRSIVRTMGKKNPIFDFSQFKDKKSRLYKYFCAPRGWIEYWRKNI